MYIQQPLHSYIKQPPGLKKWKYENINICSPDIQIYAALMCKTQWLYMQKTSTSKGLYTCFFCLSAISNNSSTFALRNTTQRYKHVCSIRNILHSNHAVMKWYKCHDKYKHNRVGLKKVLCFHALCLEQNMHFKEQRVLFCLLALS